jgi:protein involved in ribonucleotide reduction
MAYQLCTNNKRIFDFYNNYKTLDFEQINLLCIDLFENILQDATATVNKSIGSQILSECLENRVRMAELSSGLQLVNANLAKMSSDIHIKMLDIKREYVDEMKPILEKSGATLLNQINLDTVSLITSQVIDKTSILINETVPNANNQIINKVQDDIQRFYNDEFKQQLTGVVKTEQLSELFNNFCTKYDMMMQSIQTPILQVLSMNDERINKNINRQQETQEKMLTNLEDFLNKYKNNSSLKGKFSENLLHKVIIQMFPTAEITDTSKMVHTGDLVVRRENRDSIIFENKDYADNVSAEEVNKFIGDCEKQGMHGIILSQNTGITSKKNYHIDIKKGKVLVYVHNVDYSQYKIQIAVDIIDTLSEKLKDTSVEKEEKAVSKEVMAEINAEFARFVAQKEAIITVVKDCQKKIIDEIKTISFPSLERFLSSSDQITYTCDVCNRFTTQSKKVLASHKRTKECKAHGANGSTISSDKIHISIVDK